jgi:HEAT repeat protein
LNALRRSFVLLALPALAALAACERTDVPARTLDIQRWADSRTIPGDSLYALLDAKPYVLRQAAALALGRIGRPEAVPHLARVLREEGRPEVRAEAAFALGLIPTSESAVALIAGAEREPHPEVLGEIVLAVGRTGQPQTAVELTRVLQHPHPFVREQTLEALALLADSAMVDEIIQVSWDPLESVAWRAAYALEKVPNERAAERLTEMLSSGQDLVRAFAARALGRMGPPQGLRGVAGLQDLLRGDEPDWRVRTNAARSLGQLGAAEALETLDRALLDQVFHVRAAALDALAALPPLDDLDPLRHATRDASTVVRHAAYGALASALGENGYEEILLGTQDPSAFVRGRCLQLLGETGDPRALELLGQTLRQREDMQVRASAAEGLAALGGPASIVLLREFLDDEDFVVVCTVSLGLGRLGDRESIPAIMDSYRRWLARDNVDAAEAALTALGELEAEEAQVLMREALNGNDRRLRTAARDALQQILSEAEAARLPSVAEIQLDVRPIERSPQQPPLVAQSSARQLILDTQRGRIVIDLYYELAPQMCESFARLAESGFFDGLDFHRVVPNFVIQGGDPLGSGWGDAGYLLRSEWSRLRFDRGMVGIATNGKDTGSCQLFITHSPQPHLDARYTIFGKVVEGLEVMDAIEVEDSFTATANWREAR